MKSRDISGVILALAISACQSPRPSHSPGGPYYFRSGVTYKGFRPTGEISKEMAAHLAGQGYAYYIANFGDDGQPVLIEKIINGQVEHRIDLVYSNGVLSQSIMTDANGIQSRTQVDSGKK